MEQRPLTKEEQEEAKARYPDLYRHRMTTFAGFLVDFVKRDTFDDSDEEREAFYQKLWDEGGFSYWLGTYQDMLFDQKANDQAYNFWLKKTQARISDPRKRAILAPEKAPHAWGTKRPSLEQDFYEQMDRPENDVVDVKATPIVEVKENGIVTSDGQLREFDVIALATGFDSVTGGMKNMGLKDIHGVELSEKWKMGTWSYLGMTCSGYPVSIPKPPLFAGQSLTGFQNMFFLYGPQGPTAFSNGPSCVEIQGDWIIDAVAKMRAENVDYLEATEQAEETWREQVKEISDKTLFPGTSSWYMGANVPGKPREQLCYAGGFPKYEKECRNALDGWKGFATAAPA